MKTLKTVATALRAVTVIAAAAFFFTSCASNQQITPEQAQQYAAIAHGVVQNALQDYKQIKPLTK